MPSTYIILYYDVLLDIILYLNIFNIVLRHNKIILLLILYINIVLLSGSTIIINYECKTSSGDRYTIS